MSSVSQRRLRFAWAAVILCLVLCQSAALAEPDVSKQRSATRFQQAEHPDNPPAAITPAEDALARSPAGDVAFGPWVSVQVNVDSQGRNIVGDAANEPSLVINPINPNNMLIGWRQFDSITSNFRQAGWAYTMNGGASWTFPGVLTPGIFRSDPVLGTDTIGNLFYQSLKGDFTLDLFKSTNAGVSWGAPVPSFGGDKNWLAIDRSGGIGTGNIYGIWQRFSETFGLNVFTRSTNGGLSFQSPVPVVFWPTFGTMDVGADGRLYAAGIDGTNDQDFDHFVVSRSPNAQNPSQSPFFTGTQVALGGAMAFGGGPNPAGLLGQANVVVDKSTGPTRGYVYLLASVAPFDVADPLDVRLSRSIDGGITWSPPVRVNDDPSLDNYQWFGALAVAPDGRLDAVWYDSRSSGVPNISQLFYAWSYDAGATWSPNVAVSPSFDSTVGWPQQNKIGDYLGIVSDMVQAHIAYAATFNGEQDVYYLRVFPDCNQNGISDETDVAHGTSSDCDGNHVPDECQVAQVDPLCAGGGSVPDGGPGEIPLKVSSLPSGDLTLTWGASCSGADEDYEVYEGTLGDFTSHSPRLCTTSGATSITLTPGGDNTYYLVVPRNGVLEGSYGKSSGGAERPPGRTVCHPQVMQACGPP